MRADPDAPLTGERFPRCMIRGVPDGPGAPRPAGSSHDHAHRPRLLPPPPPAAGDPGPRVTGDQVRDLGRLRRSRTDRKVAGVAGGLARHLDVDPLILRVAFVVLVFFGGAGLIVYGACWLLVPEDGDDRAPFNLDERSRSIALVIVGVVAALALIGDSWGAFWFPWPVAIVALVALWLLTRNNQSPTPPGPRRPSPAAPYPTSGARHRAPPAAALLHEPVQPFHVRPAAQPAQARPDPVLVHARADRARRGRARDRRPGRRPGRRLRRTRPWRSASAA